MDIKDIENVARLARLELTDEEKEKIPQQLSKILEYIGQLDELQTENIEPMGQPLGDLMDKLRFGGDEHLEFDKRKELLKNAPDPSPVSDPEYFRVKKIIE
jgi:aspartyl-tRNA(Asn)/glutamyl-tRNA(Gln) amidotransferase subunit C